jgi:hypothetical protein
VRPDEGVLERGGRERGPGPAATAMAQSARKPNTYIALGTSANAPRRTNGSLKSSSKWSAPSARRSPKKRATDTNVQIAGAASTAATANDGTPGAHSDPTSAPATPSTTTGRRANSGKNPAPKTVRARAPYRRVNHRSTSSARQPIAAIIW